jgi:ATP-binding cassette subfamily B (MDR/TAP) protein 1
MPVFGVFLSKMLSLLTLPLEYWRATEGPDYVKDNINYYCFWMLVIALLSGIGSFLQRYMFGTLGNNVTTQVREKLYKGILEKNIGWFDSRDNAPSVLTSTMAKDTSLINGVSTESVGPQIEGNCAVLVALGVALWFCW